MDTMQLSGCIGSLSQLPLTCAGHTRPVQSVDFSGLSECSYFLISGSMDGLSMLRHGDIGDWVGTFDDHRGAVWSVALEKCALLAATGSADFSAKLWNAVTGELIHTLKHGGVVKSVAFDRYSKHLITAGSEKLIRIYDLEHPECGAEFFWGHLRSIRSAIFCRDNRCVLSTGDDRFLRLWDRVSGLEVWSQHLPIIAKSLEITDNSVASLSFGPHVRFLNMENLHILKECKLPCKVNSVSLHPMMEYFVCAGVDSMLYKYDYKNSLLVDSFKAHSDPVNTVKFSPDGELYASGADDGLLRLWQTTVGKTYGLWKMEEAPGLSNTEAN